MSGAELEAGGLLHSPDASPPPPERLDGEDSGGEAGGEIVSYWTDVRRRFFRNRLAVAGLVVLALFVFVAIFRAWITTRGYNDLTPNLRKRPFGEGWILGTDDQGRDLYTRLVYGIRTSLTLGLMVAFFDTLVGVGLGGVAAYFGGWVDNVVSRIVDIFLVIPYTIIGISMIVIFGSSFWVVVLSLVLVGWMGTARLFRAAVLQVKSLDYVEAARATGAGTWRVMRNHLLPNAIPPVIVTIAFSISGAILLESIFAFLGVGFIEPTPTLGVMIRGSRGYLHSDPHLFFVPGVTLMLLTLSIVLIGDGLRDALDPKLRGS